MENGFNIFNGEKFVVNLYCSQIHQMLSLINLVVTLQTKCYNLRFIALTQDAEQSERLSFRL